MKRHILPEIIPNWINGEQCEAESGDSFDNLSPDTGRKLCGVTRSGLLDVQHAIQAARNAQADWAGLTPVQRGDTLHDIAQAMRKHQKEIAELVALETGIERIPGRCFCGFGQRGIRQFERLKLRTGIEQQGDHQDQQACRHGPAVCEGHRSIIHRR